MSDDKKQQDVMPEDVIDVTFEMVKPDFPTVYANDAICSLTQWDMRIDFRELQELKVESKTMTVVPRVRIVMSHKFAVRFYQAMGNNLKQLARAMEEEAKLVTEGMKEASEKQNG
jgi:hypothetical protein